MTDQHEAHEFWNELRPITESINKALGTDVWQARHATFCKCVVAAIDELSARAPIPVGEASDSDWAAFSEAAER